MIPYSSVIENHDRITILCSGSSISPLTLSKLKESKCPIISINDGIEIHPNSDYWLTVNPSIFNYRRMFDKSKTKYYCAINNEDFNKPLISHVHYLKCELSSLNGLSENKSSIFGANDIIAALNLSYHMKVKKILILGLDEIENKNRFTLNGLIESILVQMKSNGIKILNGSQNSLIKSFPKTNSMNGLMWINGK